MITYVIFRNFWYQVWKHQFVQSRHKTDATAIIIKGSQNDQAVTKRNKNVAAERSVLMNSLVSAQPLPWFDQVLVPFRDVCGCAPSPGQ